MTPAVEVWNHNHWIMREILYILFMVTMGIIYNILKI